MSTFVHLIADYGVGDPAFSEVVHRLRYEGTDVTVQPTAVPPLSTVATGFWIEQLGCHNPPFEDLVVYSNTAPRTDDVPTRRRPDGGQLCYLELDNGVPVVAVDVGYNLSFVRERIREFRQIDTPETDSQFRSREHFPERVCEIAAGDTSSLADTRSVRDVPPPPESTVCHVDGYGNVKTSVRASAVPPDADRVTVELGDTTATVPLRDAVADIDEGVLALVPGSAGGPDPYMELFIRGGSAAARLGDPVPGDRLAISYS